MKREFVNIKKWVCENPDGSKVDVFLGDEVQITFDLKEGVVSEEFFKRHPDNTIKLKIVKISSREIEGEDIERPCHCLNLYPYDIVDIKKL